MAIVLLVEDNPVNAELARTVLERAGFEVRHAATASAALRLARELQPAVILMDLDLPDGDGLAVVRTLRVDGPLAATPIIALTAHAMAGVEQAALEAGCSGYIAKPIDTRSFGAYVSSIAAARKPSGGNQGGTGA